MEQINRGQPMNEIGKSKFNSNKCVAERKSD